jgi:hypothetical protein
MNKTGAAMAAAVLLLGTGVSGAFTDPILVDTSPVHNRHWETVFTNRVALLWEWNTNASRAELRIDGMNGSFATNFTEAASTCLWQAFTASSPGAEDVYQVRLTFYASGGAVVGAQTSRLAVVEGAFGAAPVDPGPSDRTWSRVRSNVLLPYDAGWAEDATNAVAGQLVIAKEGGATQTCALTDAAGYFGWQLVRSGWGYGTFDLALSFPDATTNVWSAALTRPLGGTMVRMQ